MGFTSTVAHGAGRLGRRVATRSQWLARRLWLISLAESSWVAWRHWHRLDPAERDRLLELARKSKGRPSNLSAGERREADELLDKLGHLEFLSSIATTWIPFGWTSRIATRALAPHARLSREAKEEKEES